MFDWNDEELANIIWDEAGEGDDHVVPYPDGNKDYHNKKDQNQELAATKAAAQKSLEGRHDFPDLKLGSTSKFGKHGKISSPGLSMDSWPDMSSDFVKTNQESNSEVSNSVTESKKYDPAKAGEVHNDIVGYGWENIGSFDDFDRIFGNDEPLFGHVLGNADELWSPKDVADSSIGSFSLSGSPYLGSESLTDTSDILQVKSERGIQDDPSLNLVYGEVNNPPSLSFPHTNTLLEHIECGDSKPALKNQNNFPVGGVNIATSHLVTGNNVNGYSDKVSRPKKHRKGQRKSEGKTGGKLMRDAYGAWSSSGTSSCQYEHLSMEQSCAPLAISQLRQIPGPESFHYQHISGPYFYNPALGNVATPYPLIASYKGQAGLSGTEVSPAGVVPLSKQDSLSKPPAMTPQEKIEKLRRRQQMQALLAIQKQQEQFSQQDGQAQHVERTELNLDDSIVVPLVDASSAMEQDDSDKASGAVVHYGAEDVVLRWLQDVIAKSDSRIRHCIRDSLFRLAKSAVQRHYISDNGSTNTQTQDEKEVIAKEDTKSDIRVDKITDVEMETNAIDRVVVRLLFHRPLDSTVKHLGTPENRVSSAGNLPSGTPRSFCKDAQQMDFVKTSPSESTSMVGTADSGTMEFEAASL